MRAAIILAEKINKSLDDSMNFTANSIMTGELSHEEYVKFTTMHQTFIACKERVKFELQQLIKQLEQGELDV